MKGDIKSLKVFVVDDDPFYRHLLIQLLENLGLQDIFSFARGYDALNQIHLHPDIVLLDHKMDDINGYEVLKKIKRYDPSIYVVMVSAQESIKTAVNALKHGAFDYIQKDEDTEKRMELVLSRLLEYRKLQAESKPGLLKRIMMMLP